MYRSTRVRSEAAVRELGVDFPIEIRGTFWIWRLEPICYYGPDQEKRIAELSLKKLSRLGCFSELAIDIIDSRHFVSISPNGLQRRAYAAVRLQALALH